MVVASATGGADDNQPTAYLVIHVWDSVAKPWVRVGAKALAWDCA